MTNQNVQNVQTWYACNECDQTFPTKNKVRKHYTIHVLNRIYKCRECRQLFSRQEDKNNHKCKYKNMQRWYMCDECDEMFLTEIKLNKHITKHKSNMSTKNDIV